MCAFFAIGNAIEQLLGEPAWECLPARSEWKVESTAADVSHLLKSTLEHKNCAKIVYNRVFIIDQDSCILQCCQVAFPSVRTAIDEFLRGHDVGLLVNCVNPNRVVCCVQLSPVFLLFVCNLLG